MTTFEATKTVFITTDENNTFPVFTPGHWFTRGGAETSNKLQKLLQLRSQNDLQLHVNEVKKKGNKKMGDNEYKLSDLDTHENEEFEDLRNAQNNDLDDMVF